MTQCVNFGEERKDGKKMAFTFGREATIGSWLRVRPRSFFDWEKIEGVLPPELCDQHKHEEGTPMLLEQATVRNVSRALGEINGFEWEGDFKPVARQEVKELLEKRVEERGWRNIWEAVVMSMPPIGTIIETVTTSDTC